MVRESIKAGNPAPQVIEQGENTMVVFTKGKRNRSFISYILSLPANERDSVDTLLILHWLLTSKTLSTNDAARLIQKSPDEAATVMDRLVGLEASPPIEPTRESRTRRNSVYRTTTATLRTLGSAVSYNKPPTDDIERKVHSHLNEFGKISNTTLRNILDIDVYKARDVLRRLVNDGVIERT